MKRFLKLLAMASTWPSLFAATAQAIRFGSAVGVGKQRSIVPQHASGTAVTAY